MGRSTCFFRTLQSFTATTTLEHGMLPPISPESEWRALMDEMEILATKEHRSIVFQEPRFVEYLRFVSIYSAIVIYPASTSMDDYQFGFIFLVFGISTMRATPELEYGRVKIGSGPSTRKPSGGIESLRAIPWIFCLDPDKVPSTSSAWLLEQHLSMRFRRK
ncbi:hypothetical protein DKX38_021387 [Salix brachista]|uniref:Uncharacterized protein n=1 Tax=Salix brachista TaxID=2182728 RepID=A0A5N5KBN6_9ROSI|nr:hypothetical protein DKX38_021387 [Salix brachista]